MPKTYNTFTNVSTGDVLTATNFNNVLTNVEGYRRPASCQVRRTADLTSYVSNTAITWSSSAWDTDGMYTSGTNVTVQTAGIYAITFEGIVNATATMTNISPIINIGAANVSAMTFVAASSTSQRFNMTTVHSIAASTVVQAYIAIVGGSAYVIGGAASGDTQTRMTVQWLGQVS
jgi:hypothetical protein